MAKVMIENATSPDTNLSVIDVLRTASILHFEGAKEECQEHLEHEMLESEALLVLAVAREQHLENLAQTASSVVKWKFQEAVLDADLSQIPVEVMAQVLESDCINLPGKEESLILSAVARWCKHQELSLESNNEDLKKVLSEVHLPLLLKTVRFKLIPPEIVDTFKAKLPYQTGRKFLESVLVHLKGGVAAPPGMSKGIAIKCGTQAQYFSFDTKVSVFAHYSAVSAKF